MTIDRNITPIQPLVELIVEEQKENMKVAEIGVWQGETSVAYAPTILQNKGELILVDWFYGNMGVKGTGAHCWQPDNHNLIYENLKCNLENIGCGGITTILKGDSVDMSKNISDESLDICFLDAGHNYPSVKRDIKAYLPKVKKGGILCGHDCQDIYLANSFTPEQLAGDACDFAGKDGIFRCTHPGVIQAVYDNFGYNVEIRPDITRPIPIWIYRKK
jgi:hypothetical protein